MAITIDYSGNYWPMIPALAGYVYSADGKESVPINFDFPASVTPKGTGPYEVTVIMTNDDKTWHPVVAHVNGVEDGQTVTFQDTPPPPNGGGLTGSAA